MMTKKLENKKIKKRPLKKKSKNHDDKINNEITTDSGIIVIDDNLNTDKEEAEIEERKAYLEESKSQDASD